VRPANKLTIRGVALFLKEVFGLFFDAVLSQTNGVDKASADSMVLETPRRTEH